MLCSVRFFVLPVCLSVSHLEDFLFCSIFLVLSLSVSMAVGCILLLKTKTHRALIMQEEEEEKAEEEEEEEEECSRPQKNEPQRQMAA